MHKLRRLACVLIDLILLPAGAAVFSLTGNTPRWAGASMVRLFCVSGGRSNDLMARLVALLHPPRALESDNGVLRPMPDSQIERITPVLRNRGFFVYEQRVPEAVCDRLLKFALTQPATVRLQDGQAREKNTAVYDPQHPLGVRYDFNEQDLINHPDVQALMADPAIIALAQSYLGVQPVVDVVTMWWHTAFSDQADSEAAQFYHFDLDRIKWIKFFIYLTDVASENGPHYFVAGSHRTGAIPAALLSRGYVRLRDEEVAPYYRPQDFIEFAAPRGTILAEDTRGLHKGQVVRHGHRLVLQLQFSNSLFGPAYPKISFGALRDPRLAAMVRRYPRIYSSYMAAGNVA